MHKCPLVGPPPVDDVLFKVSWKPTRDKPVCTIHDMPNDVLGNIFCFLNVKERVRTEFVCRRWRDLGKRVLWIRFFEVNVPILKEECFKDVTLTDEVFASLLSRSGPNLRKVAFPVQKPYIGCAISSQVFHTIGGSCPNLTEVRLDLQNWSADSADNFNLIHLAKKCTQLKTVFIGRSSTLDDTTLSRFLQECRSLQHLTLASNGAITEKGLTFYRRNLKSLFLYNCARVNLTVVADKLLVWFAHIEELGLNGQPCLTLSALMGLFQRYRSTLKTLHLVEHSIEPWQLLEIPSMVSQLEELSLFATDGVNDNLMSLLAETCCNLRALNISDTSVTDVGVSALATAPSLKILDVSYCKHITSGGLQIVINKGHLEELYFKCNFRIEGLNDEAFSSLTISCPNLRLLDVSYHRNITNLLVDQFCLSLKKGLLNGPVSLHLKGTKVDEKVQSCNKLNLVLQSESRGYFSAKLSL